MIKITVSKNAPLTKKRKILLESVEFYAKVLKLENYDASIVLNFKYGLSELFKVHACVDYDGNSECTIDIDAGLSFQFAIQTLAHEMVHVKQYFSGSLSWDNDKLQLWKGKHVAHGLCYTKQPWEIEAMKKECLLAAKFYASKQMYD